MYCKIYKQVFTFLYKVGIMIRNTKYIDACSKKKKE